MQSFGDDDETKLDDIAFKLFAMHCGIGRGIRQKKNLTGKMIMS